MEGAHDETNHMMAAPTPSLQENPVQERRCVKRDMGFLGQFAGEAFDHGLTRLDPAAWQIPARQIGVPHQQNLASLVEHDSADAEPSSRNEAAAQPAPGFLPSSRRACKGPKLRRSCVMFRSIQN
jgi:hypothetical protein